MRIIQVLQNGDERNALFSCEGIPVRDGRSIILTAHKDNGQKWRVHLLPAEVREIIKLAMAAPTNCGLMPNTTTREGMTMSEALDDIAAERQRQIETEGWAPEHDDRYTDGELLRAALCYARAREYQIGSADVDFSKPDALWPWDTTWWKPTTARRDLVKAAALIAAEIERMDRAEIEKRLTEHLCDFPSENDLCETHGCGHIPKGDPVYFFSDGGFEPRDGSYHCKRHARELLGPAKAGQR